MATGIVRESIVQIKQLTYASTGALTAGDILLYNGKVLIAVNTSDADADNAFVYDGAACMPKATGTTFAPGDKCYWDNSAKKITSVAGSNTLCGICLEEAESADTTIEMQLRQYNTEVTDATADSKAESAVTRASSAASLALSVSDSADTSLATRASSAASLALSVSDSADTSVATRASSAASLALSVSDSADTSVVTRASSAASLALSVSNSADTSVVTRASSAASLALSVSDSADTSLAARAASIGASSVASHVASSAH